MNTCPLDCARCPALARCGGTSNLCLLCDDCEEHPLLQMEVRRAVMEQLGGLDLSWPRPITHHPVDDLPPHLLAPNVSVWRSDSRLLVTWNQVAVAGPRQLARACSRCGTAAYQPVTGGSWSGCSTIVFRQAHGPMRTAVTSIQ